MNLLLAESYELINMINTLTEDLEQVSFECNRLKDENYQLKVENEDLRNSYTRKNSNIHR
jgi:regulator of replication initiation timing